VIRGDGCCFITHSNAGARDESEIRMNDWACFRCGRLGHLSADCPGRTPASESTRPAPPADAGPGNGLGAGVTPRRAPDPPSASYEQAKAELGIAGNGAELARLLAVRCPWCDAGPKSACVNRALGQHKNRSHEARYVAAGLKLPARPDLADAARRQVDEAKAEREEAAESGHANYCTPFDTPL
jgi:hypothetical protein